MKSEKDIKAKLREKKRDLKRTEKLFDKYDNHDDLDSLQFLGAEVGILEWVLAK